mgnify:CR=1 FL=1
MATNNGESAVEISLNISICHAGIEGCCDCCEEVNSGTILYVQKAREGSAGRR